jgi:hypothetical protein
MLADPADHAMMAPRLWDKMRDFLSGKGHK